MKYVKAAAALIAGLLGPLLIATFDAGSPAGREVTSGEVRDAILIALISAVGVYVAPRNRYPDQLSAADTRSAQ